MPENKKIEEQLKKEVRSGFDAMRSMLETVLFDFEFFDMMNHVDD
jgi:hypothetical protein